ncbi:MAG: hypothetical protein N2444_00235 [Methylocystis sp.]|nr:hypothetical protein [Methylocystis sp.]
MSIAPAFVTVSPSSFHPEVIAPFSQESGANAILPKDSLKPRLAEGDLAFYIRRLDVRTRAAANQASANVLPSASIAMSLISAPTYKLRVRATWDQEDVTAFGRHNIDLVHAHTLAMRQAHRQLARSALLHGLNPANGEGVLNAPGAVITTLPPDRGGNTTVIDYDSGEMAEFLMRQVAALKARTNHLGVGRKIAFLGPQRLFAMLEYYHVVTLVQFQRPGAGTATVKGLGASILDENDDVMVWAYDDTLIGKGPGGTDAVLVVMSDVRVPEDSMPSTNEFMKIAPNLRANVLQLYDRAAPSEYPSPIAGGATDVISEWRITSGWGIRPEAVTVIGMQYE